MNSINEQLGIGIAPSPLFPTRYTRGLKTMNPQLGTEDWALDFYNDIGFQNANGYSNLYGTRNCKKYCKQLFPFDNKLKGACKATCKTTCNRDSKCPPKGATPYPTKKQILSRAGVSEEEAEATAKTQSQQPPTEQPRNVKKIAIGVGVVVLFAVGLIVVRKIRENKS